MKKLTAVLMASVFVTMTVPARANDELIRLGVGAAIWGVGKLMENGGKAQPKQSQQKAAPQNRSTSTGQSAPRTQVAAPRPARVPDENVRWVQEKLNALGYTEVGSADGFGGSNTSKAIGLFMADNAISGEPNASPELIAALGTAKTRQEIAEAKTSAIAEATMPASKVEDGIVHFEPKPEQMAAEAAHIETEEAIAAEDFSEEALKPVAAVEATVAEPAVEKPVEVPAVVVETKPGVVPAVVAPLEVAKPAKPVDEKVEEADAGAVTTINGMAISSDF